MVQRVPTAKLSSCDTPERTEEVKNGMQPFESHAILKWYDILPEQPKEKAQKAQICHILLI